MKPWIFRSLIQEEPKSKTVNISEKKSPTQKKNADISGVRNFSENFSVCFTPSSAPFTRTKRELFGRRIFLSGNMNTEIKRTLVTSLEGKW